MKIFPIIVKKITQIIQGRSANVIWQERVNFADPVMGVINLGGDTVTIADNGIVTNPKFSEAENLGDSLNSVSGTTPIPDTEQFVENGALSIQSWAAVGRSGTPDSDAWGDAWTDGTTGQTGTNHGNTVSMNVNALATANQVAWIEVDLTRFSGLTATAGGIFKIFGNGSSIATAVTVGYFTSASRPFTESTITNANAPTTAVTSLGSQTLASGALSAELDYALSQSDVAAMLCKWVCFKVTGPVGQTLVITINARETGGSVVPTLVLSGTKTN